MARIKANQPCKIIRQTLNVDHALEAGDRAVIIACTDIRECSNRANAQGQIFKLAETAKGRGRTIYGRTKNTLHASSTMPHRSHVFLIVPLSRKAESYLNGIITIEG